MSLVFLCDVGFWSKSILGLDKSCSDSVSVHKSMIHFCLDNICSSINSDLLNMNTYLVGGKD